ncbi:glutathione binding-like protein [Pelagerythrobacter sp.]|uniref:glutathione binding-like protein n=1 Tax=Pelagerythrobacter sp. TaxID=2800702 RepID=UPI0035AFDD14
MKLYYAPGACSLASHIALIESGRTFDKVKVDLGKHQTEDGEDFYAISPRGYVPAIASDDFDVLTENPAVLAYVADWTGAAPKGNDHYRMLEWLGFIGTELHGGYHPLFGKDTDERQAKAKKALADKYQLTEKLMDGREWLVGDGPTVADNYLFVTLLWADKFGVELPDTLKEYRKRNLARDSVKQAMAAEGLG